MPANLLVFTTVEATNATYDCMSKYVGFTELKLSRCDAPHGRRIYSRLTALLREFTNLSHLDYFTSVMVQRRYTDAD